MNVQTIETLQREGILDALILVDVRTPAEFRSLHATGAINIPLDEFSQERLKLMSDDGIIGLLCQGGSRAKTAYKQLENSQGIIVVEGGTQAWEAAQLPVVCGKQVISLERQVRIAAGLLVFLGVCFGYFIHPAGLFVAGFVGAGLTFAGVTDTCGMGIMLSKCSWNKV